MKYRITLEEIEDGEVQASFTRTCHENDSGRIEETIAVLLSEALHAMIADDDQADILLRAMRFISASGSDSELCRFLGECNLAWWSLPDTDEVYLSDYILQQLWAKYPTGIASASDSPE